MCGPLHHLHKSDTKCVRKNVCDSITIKISQRGMVLKVEITHVSLLDLAGKELSQIPVIVHVSGNE
jgi:hypothetical protein